MKHFARPKTDSACPECLGRGWFVDGNGPSARSYDCEECGGTGENDTSFAGLCTRVHDAMHDPASIAEREANRSLCHSHFDAIRDKALAARDGPWPEMKAQPDPLEMWRRG